MIYAKNNSYVRLRFTGQLALVLAYLDDGFLEVQIVNDKEIITVAEDHTVAVGGSLPQTDAPEAVFDAYDSGISAKLIPGFDGGMEYCYHLYFSNGTPQRWVAEAGLWDAHRKLLRQYFTVDPSKTVRVFRFSRDYINLRPLMSFKIRKMMTTGTGEELTAEIRLKAKTLFKRKKDLFDGRYCYQFELDDLLRNGKKEAAAFDIIQRERMDTADEYYYRRFEYTTMSHEKDLHIEALVDDPMSIDKNEILHIQLREMTKYVEKAATHNLDHVFLIHGLGKGILRDKIHDSLQEMPCVKEYKNEYHPRYGWGATEVFLS